MADPVGDEAVPPEIRMKVERASVIAGLPGENWIDHDIGERNSVTHSSESFSLAREPSA